MSKHDISELRQMQALPLDMKIKLTERRMNYCKLKTTGCRRTGCIYCGFGCHLEKGQTRFQRLKETHPKQYNFCINGGQYNDKGLWVPSKEGLGLAHVFDELNKVYGENFIRYK